MVAYHSDQSRVDASVLTNLIAEAGLGTRAPSFVERVFRGSSLCCFAENNGALVGAGRAISDGVSNSAIFDLVVHPYFQNQGIGTAILQYLLERLPQRSVLLVSVPARGGFYKRFGFHRLKTAYLRHEDIDRWISDGYIETEP